MKIKDEKGKNGARGEEKEKETAIEMVHEGGKKKDFKRNGNGVRGKDRKKG